jgi:hypothetical protein
MAYNVRHTEHCGAKNGGGHWGRRTEAKVGSNHRRREADKDMVKQACREAAADRLVVAGGKRETR